MQKQLQQLQLAQHYYAPVIIEPIPVKQLVELTQLVDATNTIQPIGTPLELPTRPVIYLTDDGQCQVLNAPQVMMGANLSRLHSKSRVLTCRLTEPADLPMARLFYGILEPARLFADIDPLIHTAYAGNHSTALLNQHLLTQRPDQPITTEQIVVLCGGRVRKSTINNRKRTLGYTNSSRGCKAREAREANNDVYHSHAN
jgi:hypothetical protein